MTSGSPARRRGGSSSVTLSPARGHRASASSSSATGRLSQFQIPASSTSTLSNSVPNLAPSGYVVHPLFAGNTSATTASTTAAATTASTTTPTNSSTGNTRPRNWRILTTVAVAATMATNDGKEGKGESKRDNNSMNTSTDETLVKLSNLSISNGNASSSGIEFSCPQMVPCLISVLHHRLRVARVARPLLQVVNVLLSHCRNNATLLARYFYHVNLDLCVC
jgi:hypothetical protein